MTIERCVWCHTNFPSPLPENIDDIFEINFPLRHCCDDTNQIELDLPAEVKLETINVVGVHMRIGQVTHRLYVHDFCQEPFVRSLNSLIHILSDYRLCIYKCVDGEIEVPWRHTM